MIPLIILTPMILFAGAAAVWLARPVHAALMLAASLALIAVLYLVMGADFVGLVQFMVYVGAIAVLMVFSLMITRAGDESAERERRPKSTLTGLICAGPVLGVLLYMVARSPATMAVTSDDAPRAMPLRQVGELLFGPYAAAVIAMAVLLTAVMIGAALFAREPRKSLSDSES